MANSSNSPAPVPVREVSQDGSEHELHHGEYEAEPAAVHSRATEALAGELDQQSRIDRHDESKADRIQQQRHRDKRERVPGGPDRSGGFLRLVRLHSNRSGDWDD
jgi:hypothetical protein